MDFIKVIKHVKVRILNKHSRKIEVREAWVKSLWKSIARNRWYNKVLILISQSNLD